jgi:hypothetical protein
MPTLEINTNVASSAPMQNGDLSVNMSIDALADIICDIDSVVESMQVTLSPVSGEYDRMEEVPHGSTGACHISGRIISSIARLEYLCEALKDMNSHLRI